jgi:hypothetical protein
MVRTRTRAPEVRGTVEVACDESGFVGGSLFGGTRVFAHASVHLDLLVAVDLAEEVRTRTGAGSDELKASRLNRPWGHPVAEWLCRPDGPLQGRAVVHVTDTRLFGLARLAQVLLTDSLPEGWWSAQEDREAWDLALRLHRLLARLPQSQERRILDCARDLLWLNRNHHPQASIGTWADVMGAVVGRLDDADDRRFVAGWSAPDALRRARDYVAVPPRSPLTEPLLPALRWAVRHWSALGDVIVVHDEQSVLTPARVAAIAEELAASRPGRRLAGFSRVDSRQDARVQLADLVAGVVRRTVEDRLSGSRSASAVPISHLVADGSPVLEHAARPGLSLRAQRNRG